MGILCNKMTKKSNMIPLEYFYGNYYIYLIFYSLEDYKKFKCKILLNKGNQKNIKKLMSLVKQTVKIYENSLELSLYEKATKIHGIKEYENINLECSSDKEEDYDCCYKKILYLYNTDFLLNKISYGDKTLVFDN